MDDTMSDGLESRDEQEMDPTEQKAINEEYKTWKKNTMFLYDTMYSRALEWPTLTTQWLPYNQPIDGTGMTAQRILLGTNTSNQGQDYLQIAEVDVPDMSLPDLAELDEQRGEAGGYGAAKSAFDFKIIQKINHPGEVNKARYQPQNSNIIATLCPDGRVLIFDRTKHPSMPKEDGTIKTEAELHGHENEGFGLNWSTLLEGHLVTGNQDNTVRTWDIRSGFNKVNNTIAPTATYTHHSATVNDVQYHPIHNFLIGSASDDLTWQIIDTRVASHKKPLYRKQAHSDAVNCIAFHPEYEMMMATGSADKTVALWDLRNFDKKIHSMEAHTDTVISIQWHPQDPAILASSGYDRRICMWDISKIGEEQSENERDDGPPELLFMHAGFTNRICDFDWNRVDENEWVMLAAAEDNQLQIFRPARKLVEPITKNPTHEQVSD